jgi:hypothetical protein
MDNNLIITELKKLINAKNDKDLIEFLGCKQSTFSSWKNVTRTIDLELIKSKFPNLDMNWVYSNGKIGNILLETPVDRVLKAVKYMNKDLETVYNETGIVAGVLENKAEISDLAVSKFLRTYPQFNREWITLGNGTMMGDYNNPLNISDMVQENTSGYVSSVSNEILSELARRYMTVENAVSDLRSLLVENNILAL